MLRLHVLHRLNAKWVPLDRSEYCGFKSVIESVCSTCDFLKEGQQWNDVHILTES